MEKRKSIQDIMTTKNDEVKNISDIISEKSRTRRKKLIGEDVVEKPTADFDNKVEDIDNTIKSNTLEVNDLNLKTKIKEKLLSKLTKIRKIIVQIKPVYLLSFSVLIIAIITTIILQLKPENTSMEQSKKEADIVKKSLSRHIRLPEEEQIDIRKITNKVEDPFFKDANIGDYLIIFYKNRIAYIYSIDKDIIINAGVVFIDPKTATTTSSTNKKI